jgi:hypothetical protein
MKKSRQFLFAAFVLIFFLYFKKDAVIDNSKTIKENSLQELVSNQLSDQIITVEAIVIKLLTDDNKGSRHQKFIVKVADISLLIVHNIDIAPRVPISVGDIIKLKGEYEWNQHGGLIHWTHRDKSNKHPNGWIEYNKIRYQ